jgi:hypothetical protein
MNVLQIRCVLIRLADNVCRAAEEEEEEEEEGREEKKEQ